MTGAERRNDAEMNPEGPDSLPRSPRPTDHPAPAPAPGTGHRH
ncbi:hypothetical protein [Saccharopolyspora dendranthemae]|nr:hypothetical protein [Saccharopolyspora dendranthemae]